MKKLLLTLLLIIFVFVGCDKWTDKWKNKRYEGKLFNIKAIYYNDTEDTWENANMVEYNKEEDVDWYSFYIDGKLVVLDSWATTVIIEEVGVKKSSKENKYAGKKYDLTVVFDNKSIKKWKNVEMKLCSITMCEFVCDGRNIELKIPSFASVMLEEVSK